ncbi:MAG: DedA family protein [Candidatus Berkelbacteria bacterium]|nr:DedA family protein [Candidatus Berkelbacteria bacterium]
MIYSILSAISVFIVGVISKLSYFGIVLLMGIESACIPLPSEVIMPFSGYLVFDGQFNLFWVGFFGALGCLFGSIIAYIVGYYGGRPLIEKYGKYILISHHDLEKADSWFKKYGNSTVFFSRLLPVIRTYISFPAGIARMNFIQFCIYTFLGSFPWTLGLAYIGLRLGERWELLREYFKRFDILIGVIIILGIVWYVTRHMKNIKKQNV